jgi:putative transposase
MTNHVHLIAVPEREGSLARTLGCTHSEYALALNHAHGRSGHVWQNRFFSCPLGESHLLSALRYVELNPVRAGLASEPSGWPWSSARAHTVSLAFQVVRFY